MILRMAWEQIELMPEPAPEIRPFSARYAVPLYRWKLGVPSPKWANLSTTTIPCDECFALQHESRGAYGSRHQAKRRRTLPPTRQREGTVLNLCRSHAMSWQERDDADRGDPRGTLK